MMGKFGHMSVFVMNFTAPIPIENKFSNVVFLIHIILKCFPDFLHIQHLKIPRQFCQLCLQTKQIY